MKKVTAMILAAGMVFALAGCGGSGGSGTAGNGGSGKKLEATLYGHEDWVGDIELNDIPDDQRDITILMSAGWDYWESMHSDETPEPHVVAKKIWEETLGGTVTIQVVTETLMTSYLASAIANDTAPDIISGNFFPNWSITDFTTDLSDEELAPYIGWGDDIWDMNASQKWIWDGEQTGLRPYTEHDPWVIAYNKTKFEAAGEKTPLEYYNEGKWTWTQFVQTAKNMTDVTKDEYGYIGLYLQPKVEYRLDETGHFYLDVTADQMRKNTEIFNFFQGNGHPARCSNKNLDFRTLFAGGTDAMTVLGLAEYERLVTTAEANGGDEYGVAPMFAWDVCGETTPVLQNSTWAYTICSASNKKIGAAEYVHLEAQVMKHLEDLEAQKNESNYYTAEEEKAIQEVFTLIDEQEIDLATRSYDLQVGGFSFDQIMFTSQNLSMQGLIDQGKTTAQAELDKINKNIDLYKKD